jgi:hypothetical protein
MVLSAGFCRSWGRALKVRSELVVALRSNKREIATLNETKLNHSGDRPYPAPQLLRQLSIGKMLCKLSRWVPSGVVPITPNWRACEISHEVPGCLNWAGPGHDSGMTIAEECLS